MHSSLTVHVYKILIHIDEIMCRIHDYDLPECYCKKTTDFHIKYDTTPFYPPEVK